MKGFLPLLPPKDINPEGQHEQEKRQQQKNKTNKNPATTRERKLESRWTSGHQLAGLAKLTPEPAAGQQPCDLCMILAKGSGRTAPSSSRSRGGGLGVGGWSLRAEMG